MEKVDEIELAEEVETVEEKPTTDELIEAGVSPQEAKMAEDHGLSVKEREGKTEKLETEKPAETTEEKTEDQIAREIIANPDVKYDDLKKNKNFTPNVKSLYWEQKKARKRAQDAEKALQGKSSELELTTAKKTAAEERIKKINALLNGNQESITIEALQEILGDQSDLEISDDKPLTVKNLKEIEEKKVREAEEAKYKQDELSERLAEQRDKGEDRYGKEDFDHAIMLAEEVVKSDKTGVYGNKILEALNSAEEGKEFCDVVMTISKLHPEYGKKIEAPKVDAKPVGKAIDRDKVARIVKNAEKKPAVAGGSGGRRTVLEADLTSADVSRLSQAQWDNLKPETKRRLMGG